MLLNKSFSRLRTFCSFLAVIVKSITIMSCICLAPGANKQQNTLSNGALPCNLKGVRGDGEIEATILAFHLNKLK